MSTPANASPPKGFGQHVWIAAVLGNIHEAGIVVSTCVAGAEAEEFFASCLTCKTALGALAVVQRSATGLPTIVRKDLGGVDWVEWEALAASLPPVTASQRDQVWYAMRVLVPVLMTSLRRLRRHSPERFNPGGFRA